MRWRTTLYVLSAVLLCTSLLVASDPTAKRAAQPQSTDSTLEAREGNLNPNPVAVGPDENWVTVDEATLNDLRDRRDELKEDEAALLNLLERKDLGDESKDRACSDCLTPNTALGDITMTPWGGTISSDCGTGGKWYASFTGVAAATYYFDLCADTPGAGTANFDADIKIVNSACTILSGVDGSCSGSTYRPNNFSWSCPAAGTYYVVVAPYNSYASHTCIGTAANTFTLQYYRTAPQYCTSGATTTADELISNVRFGTINNTTADCDTYNDFTALSTNVDRGSTYSLSVSVGMCTTGCYGKWVKVYIDWNQNLSFADAGEQVLSASLTNTQCPATVTGNVTVPITALLGPTRMRVVVKESGTEANTLSCGTFSWGGTEDYTVAVQPAPPVGACCFPPGFDVCTPNISSNGCALGGGRYHGDGSDCTTNLCKGACCELTGSCADTVSGTCTGSSYAGDGTTCSPTNPCPQPGNTCANPKPLTISQALLPIVDTDTTCGRGNEYADTCLGYYDGGEDMIYHVTVLEPVCVKIAVDGVLTYVGVAIDSACPPGATCLASATDSGGNPATGNVSLTAGEYTIMVDTWPSPDCTAYTMTISGCPTAPPNDDCAGAIAVGNGTPAVTGDNCGALADLVEASCQSNSNKDVWYDYTATCTGTVQMSTEGSAQSDTVLSVYSACGGTEIACDDDSGTGTLSLLSFQAVAGTHYKVRVASYSAGCGGYNLNISCTEAPQGVCCDGTPCHVTYEMTCTGTYGGDGSVCSGLDCDGNTVDDFCDLLAGVPDCQPNGIPDTCDIAGGTSADLDGNGVPDTCDPDCNNNLIPDGCDISCAGGCAGVPGCGLSHDCQNDGIPDECQLGRGDARVTYSLDDGTHEDSIGISAGADLGALVLHTVVTGGGKIESISIAWGDVPVGVPVNVYVWSDPNQDGNPADGLVIGHGSTTTQNVDLDVFNLVTLDAPANVGPVGTKFFIGFVYVTTGTYEYPIAIDTTTPVAGRNWIVGSAYHTPPIDPNNLDDPAYNVALSTTEAAGFASNLMIRAEGAAAGADCNANGTPDECDVPPLCVGAGCSADCNHNLIPDACEPDCNNNGTPDDCDIAGGAADCNANGTPDACELTGHDCNNNGIIDSCELAGHDCNNNGIIDSCDIAAGTSEDCQPDGIPDECQLGKGTRADVVVDGSFEAGVTNPNWTATSTNFGTPLCDSACGTGAGTAAPRTGLIWAWFGGAGSTSTIPEIGSLEQTVTIASSSTATLNFYMWIGSYGSATDIFNVKMDGTVVFTTFADNAAYATGYTLVTVDLTAYANGGSHVLRFDATQYTTTATNINVDDVSLDVVPAGPSANDCNENGIPDECDIAAGTSHDYNQNGVPDECELCGDITGNGVVDVDDYWALIDATATCTGNVKYNPAADMDGSGCINIVDYQAWLQCYRMANGKDFVVPRKKRPIVTPPVEATPIEAAPAATSAGTR